MKKCKFREKATPKPINIAQVNNILGDYVFVSPNYMSTVLSSTNTVIDTRHVMYGEIHMLVTNKEVLNIDTAEGYAVGAFNINNIEILQVIVEATTEEKSPITISVSPSAFKYAGLEYVTAMVKAKMRLFGSSGKAP